MSDRLPVHLDPILLADQGRSVGGPVEIGALDRLGPALHDTEGELAVQLRFGRDVEGRRHVQGTVEGALHLQCERCLSVYALPVELTLDLVLVDSEAEADLLPDEIDALVVTDRAMHTVDIIEDDLILALPLVSRCQAVQECVPAVELLDSESVEAGDQGERQHPFADLRDRL